MNTHTIAELVSFRMKVGVAKLPFTCFATSLVSGGSKVHNMQCDNDDIGAIKTMDGRSVGRRDAVASQEVQYNGHTKTSRAL